MIDLSHEISDAHPSALCALCDNLVEAIDAVTTVTAHGCKHQVHRMCVENLDDAPEEIEDDEHEHDH